jgi:hypothetical protein
MRYFPQRALRKTSMSARLSVCTHCLGDLFADGRCVQCRATLTAGAVRQPLPSPGLIAPIVYTRPALN